MGSIAANPGTPWLIAGGALVGRGGMLHLASSAGPDWYRCGRGYGSRRGARRRIRPHNYGHRRHFGDLGRLSFSGAGYLPRLPLLRTALILITAIYLLRALAFVPVNLATRLYSDGFAIWSSLIVLLFGAMYATGTWKAWRYLAS